MTSTPPAGTSAQACKRPGCGNTLPASPARGRHRVFCSDDCARRYHNDARVPAPAPSPGGPGDPLAALEHLTRQAAALIKAARDQAAHLNPPASAPRSPTPKPPAAAPRPPPSPPRPARPKPKPRPSPKPSPPPAATPAPPRAPPAP